jgi:uncharacterized protein (TIGR02466 family)
VAAVRCEALFCTPLWSSQHPDPVLLQGLATTVLSLEAADPAGIQRTNQGGWHSPVTLLDQPQFAGLFHWIAAEALGAFEAWGWDLNQALPCFHNAWAMVNRKGSSTRAHLHPNSFFSGVCYLQVPAGSGAIAFLDPRSGAQMLQPPMRSDARGDHSGRVVQQPYPGLLLLFPSWLWHEVEPSSCQEPRICISFNLGLRPVKTRPADSGGTATEGPMVGSPADWAVGGGKPGPAT